MVKLSREKKIMDKKEKQKRGGKQAAKRGRRVSCWAIYSSVWWPFFAAVAPALGVGEPFATVAITSVESKQIK